MKRQPKFIDADFEVVRGADHPTEETPSGRIGFSYFSVPAAWREWGWFQRIFYVVGQIAVITAVAMFTAWLKGVIPLPDHW